MTEEFLVSHNKTTQALGAQQASRSVTSEGEVVSRTFYRATAIMTSEVWEYVSRGHTSDPGVTPSSQVSTAHPGAADAFSDFVGSSPLHMPSWAPKWEAATGTVITVQSGRVNEAGFWEKRTTVETRTCTPSYSPSWNL